MGFGEGVLSQLHGKIGELSWLLPGTFQKVPFWKDLEGIHVIPSFFSM